MLKSPAQGFDASSSPLEPKEAWLWFLPAAVVAFLATLAPLSDPDLFWHLKTGEWILQHRALPSVNTFSYTEPNHPWFVFEWLSQVTFYLLYRTLDIWGIYLLRAVLVVGAFALWFRVAVNKLREPAAALVFLLVLVAFLRYRFGERPELFSQLLVALFAARLLIKNPLTAKDWLPLWLLQILWVNLHGYFFVGILLSGWWVFRHWSLSGEPFSNLLKRSAGVLGLIVASCINPWGPKIFTFLLAHKKSVVLQFVMEFRSATLLEVSPTVAGFLVCSVVALGISALNTAQAGRRFSQTLPATEAWWHTLRSVLGLLSDAAVLGVVLYMGHQHVRFLWLLAVLSMPISLLSLSAFQGEALLPSRLALLPRLAALVLAAVAVWQVKPATWNLALNEKQHYPVQAMAFVDKHKLHGRLYNEYGHGGWFIFRYYPRLKTFMDGRFAFSDKFYQDYFDVTKDPAHFRRLIKKYGVKLVVMPVTSPRAMHYSFFPADGPFKVVYFDIHNFVAVPKAKAPDLPGYELFCPCLNEGSYYLPQFNHPGLRPRMDKEMQMLSRQTRGEGNAFVSRWYRITGRPRQSLKALKELGKLPAYKDIYQYETVLSHFALGHRNTARKIARTTADFADTEWLNTLTALGMKKKALELAQRSTEENLLTAQAYESAQWLSQNAPSRLERKKWRRMAAQSHRAYINYRMVYQFKNALSEKNFAGGVAYVDAAQRFAPKETWLEKILNTTKKETGAVYPEDLPENRPMPR